MSHVPPTNGNYPTCEAQRRDGAPCQARALPGRPFCWAHDPELADKRQAARSQGGANKSNVIRIRRLLPARLGPIFDQLETALTEVHEGDLAPRQAQAMASLARALVALLVAGEMEERLRHIEERLSGKDQQSA